MPRVLVCFLEEIEDSKKAFRNYLTFNLKMYLYQGCTILVAKGPFIQNDQNMRQKCHCVQITCLLTERGKVNTL